LPVEDTVLSAVLGQVSRRILEKLEKGKKLTAEDILLLYMDMTYTELRGIREELRETNRRIDETNRRIDTLYQDLSRRIDAIYRELVNRMESVRKELAEKMVEINRRMDKLYELRAVGEEPRRGGVQQS